MKEAQIGLRQPLQHYRRHICNSLEWQHLSRKQPLCPATWTALSSGTCCGQQAPRKGQNTSYDKLGQAQL